MSALSRRDLLRLSAAGAAALLSGPLLAGCGDDGEHDRDTTPAPLDPDSLRPFEADTSEAKPTGLPERCAWASTADSEFFLALGKGMSLAAAARGLEYVTAVSGNDPAKHVRQMEDFLTRGVGSMAMQPLSPDADAVVLRKSIAQGVCTQGIITGPSTMQVVASQYRIGYDQGKAAADYVKANLGGSAQAIYFNLDTASPQLQLRHRGVLDGLKTAGGGIEVVRDVTVAEISTTSGFNTMMSALQSHRDIKVVLGGDTIVVGAYKALQESGQLKDDMFLSGVDGDSEALALVRLDGAYKLSIAFAWTLMGYGLGQFGADWIEGRRVPQLIVAKGVHLDSPEAVGSFSAASADPAGVFADRARYETYLPLFGEVSHTTRERHWTTPVDPPKSAS